MRKGTLAMTVWLSTALLAVAAPAAAQFYQQDNLVSDVPGAAKFVDPDLVNAWGLTSSATSPWWVANNGTGTATLYDSAGVKFPLTVRVPGKPTGIVFNGDTGFIVTNGADSGTARFIFASEDGTISGWNPAVPPPPPATQAFVAVDNSAAGAVYKGLAIAGERLYATNFRAATVEVYDNAWKRVPGGFTDATIPQGYAPFGIQNLNGVIYVTYAQQDEDKEDDVAGRGHGFVNAFDQAGMLLRRVASRGRLDSPWGLAFAPADFGKFSNDLLVGNFGDGRINAFSSEGARELERRSHGRHGNRFDICEFARRGSLRDVHGGPIEIDGLWALAFGNGATAGPKTTLFFTAGPADEEHGLFGTLVAAGPARRHGEP
jgi:uncharacterized protein (TIGR03118 family)